MIGLASAVLLAQGHARAQPLAQKGPELVQDRPETRGRNTVAISSSTVARGGVNLILTRPRSTVGRP